MENFSYYNPTRIVFGKGSIRELASLVPDGLQVMLLYGGGSIRTNGVYDQVRGALGARQVLEFGGIGPNPEFALLMQAVELVRSRGVGFLLAVGGGSVIDGAKFVAAAAPFAGDPWQFLAQRGVVVPSTAVPLGVVLTLPATGSESNPFAVISRAATHEKLAFDHELLYPRFAILDPRVTFSLPLKQVRNGVVDAYVHATEQYLTYPVDSPLQDRQAEGILLTLLAEGPKTLANPTDYAARANVMWCATQALNRLIACGVPRDFATHLIGHELTAFYGLAHAESLVVVQPRLLRHQRANKREKLLQYAARVWGLDPTAGDTAIDAAIDRTEVFYRSLGMPTRLSEHGISAAEAAERVRERFARRGTRLGERRSIGAEEAADILRQCG